MILFKKALLFALTAEKTQPQQYETLHMLSGIYFGMNEMEVSKHYVRLAQEAN